MKEQNGGKEVEGIIVRAPSCERLEIAIAIRAEVGEYLPEECIIPSRH
jgi:hypothetical protein